MLVNIGIFGYGLGYCLFASNLSPNSPSIRFGFFPKIIAAKSPVRVHVFVMRLAE